VCSLAIGAPKWNLADVLKTDIPIAVLPDTITNPIKCKYT